MTIRIRALGALAGLFSLFALMGTTQAQERPYTEGTVSVVSSIRTLPGMHQTYMNYLATTYRQLMEEQKKAGIIVAWSVYQVQPRGPDDPNVYLVTTYKNLAAMDGLSDKTEAIQSKLIGTQQQRDAAMVDREKMRKGLGTEMIREVVFK